MPRRAWSNSGPNTKGIAGASSSTAAATVPKAMPARRGDRVAAAKATAPSASAVRATGVQAAMALSVTPTTSSAAEVQRSRTARAPSAGHTSTTRLTTARTSVASASGNRLRRWAPTMPNRAVASAAGTRPSGNR